MKHPVASASFSQQRLSESRKVKVRHSGLPGSGSNTPRSWIQVTKAGCHNHPTHESCAWKSTPSCAGGHCCVSQLAKDGRSAPLPLGKPAEREKPGISPLSKAGSPLAPRRESASLIFRSAETESPTFRVCLAAQRHQWPGLATCNQFPTPLVDALS